MDLLHACEMWFSSICIENIVEIVWCFMFYVFLFLKQEIICMVLWQLWIEIAYPGCEMWYSSHCIENTLTLVGVDAWVFYFIKNKSRVGFCGIHGLKLYIVGAGCFPWHHLDINLCANGYHDGLFSHSSTFLHLNEWNCS